MAIIIVGRKDNERQIQWLNFFAMAPVLGMVSGLSCGGLYYLLCGLWSHWSVLLGFITGVGLVLVNIIFALRMPIDKLKEIK